MAPAVLANHSGQKRAVKYPGGLLQSKPPYVVANLYELTVHGTVSLPFVVRKEAFPYVVCGVPCGVATMTVWTSKQPAAVVLLSGSVTFVIFADFSAAHAATVRNVIWADGGHHNARPKGLIL